MKTTLALLLLALPLALPAAESTNRLQFPASGFSIAPLDAAPSAATRQALIMLLPASGNFAANVNVQIQPFNGTMDEYVELTQKQFKDAGLKMIEQKKQGKTTILVEYSGEIQGQAMHWYARAEKSGSSVYLATAAGAESEWSKQGPQLKACVDSLRCDSPASKPAPAR